jgi:hypothetical protein
MLRRASAIGLVLLASACAPPARFAATSLPVGTFEMIPQQCHWGEDVHHGTTYSGLQFTSGGDLGTMIFIGRERAGPAILPASGQGLAVIWRLDGTHRTPTLAFPASACEVFRFTTNTSPRLGGATTADFELRCATADGGTFVGSGRFTEICH